MSNPENLPESQENSAVPPVAAADAEPAPVPPVVEPAPVVEPTPIPPTAQAPVTGALPYMQVPPTYAAGGFDATQSAETAKKVGNAYNDLLKGNLEQAFDKIAVVKDFWLLSLILIACASGLFIGFFTSRSVAVAYDWIPYGFLHNLYPGDYYYNSYLGLGFIRTVLLVMVSIFSVGAYLSLRSFALLVFIKKREDKLSFQKAMNLVGFSYLPLAFMLAGLFLISVLPLVFLVSLVQNLLPLVIFGGAMLAETLTYLGANRGRETVNSPLVTYVIGAVLAVGVADIIWTMLSGIVLWG